MTKIFILFVLLSVFGCDRSSRSYPVGRDTYKQFGNGRFELFRQNGKKVFADCENERKFTVGNVIQYKQVANCVYLLTEDNYSFHVVDISIPSIRSYYHIHDVPASDQTIFIALMRL